MFDDAHYVPVLRWKSGERGALRDLSEADRQSLTPLIELLPGHMRARRAKHGPPTSDDLWVSVEQLADTCGRLPVFIDVSRVRYAPYKGGTNRSILNFFSALGAANLYAVPVTFLNEDAAFQTTIRNAIRIDDRGVAIRIPISDLASAKFPEKLHQLVSTLEVSPENVDLIVEYGMIGVAAPTLSYVCHRVPMLRRWRTLTVLAGSFPPDLTAFKRPGQYEIPRHEWTKWVAEVHKLPSSVRRPSFGDYTIQHPVYVEPVDGANPSVSIRYACDTYWLIMRGQALRKKGGGTRHAQYPANAELLCARKEFAGAHHSAGDEYIWNIGSHKEPGPGTPETWLRAGINHHLVLTARQVPGSVALTA